MAIVDAARANDVFLMEAFMYRCHPQMPKLFELIRSGVIGRVCLIEASFAYHAGFDPRSRCYAQSLGGGGILDVGCYPVSVSRLIAGAHLGRPFADPIEVKGAGHLGKTGVDEWAAATLRFEDDVVAQVTTGIGLNMHEQQVVRIYGSEGKITIPDPWCPSRFNRNPARIILKRQDEKGPQEILVEAPLYLYTYEADTVAANIANRQAPAMSWDDTLGNIKTLDRWRQEVGLVYEMEKPENGGSRTIAGRDLTIREGHNMRYGRIPGLEKQVSRLIFGCDSNHTWPDTAVMLDDYFERGGCAFDTSTGYGIPNGANERNLGWWVRNRGVRDQVVIIEKGANAPNASPEGLTKELLIGLDRLQMDQVDIYMIHRDNIQVPIEEWVDVLNEHWRAGKMKIFGVSNFTLPRLRAAQEYARKKGIQGFSVVSNNFALARMLDPVWELCVSASDPEFREWFVQTGMPLLPWSSQARGFFTERASRTNLSNPEFNRCWYSEENFQRKERANEMAREKGVEPINIALAYVLCQPFPTFPLIGPKQISETRSCVRALDIELTPAEVRWLDEG